MTMNALIMDSKAVLVLFLLLILSNGLPKGMDTDLDSMDTDMDSMDTDMDETEDDSFGPEVDMETPSAGGSTQKDYENKQEENYTEA